MLNSVLHLLFPKQPKKMLKVLLSVFRLSMLWRFAFRMCSCLSAGI